MNDQQQVKVEEDLYVNDATVELLRRRIESDVKKGFFTSVGVPIGGAGIVAILYLLFSWIPAQLASILEENRQIQEYVESSVKSYLDDEDRGASFIRSEVNNIAHKYIDQAVRAHVVSDETRAIVKSVVTAQTKAYYESPDASELVESLVKQNMESDMVRSQINNAVKVALEPLLTALTSDIGDNLNAFVYDSPEVLGAEKVTKAGFGQLQSLLQGERAADIRLSGAPVLLTFRVKSAVYVREVIEGYIDQMQDFFGEQFGYVMITDRAGKLAALVPRQAFSAALASEGDLVSWLNGQAPNSSPDYLEDLFGKEVRISRTTGARLRDLLADRDLWRSLKPGTHLPVVDLTGKFVGLTNPEKLIEGLAG